jgi:hypothetical protein
LLALFDSLDSAAAGSPLKDHGNSDKIALVDKEAIAFSVKLITTSHIKSHGFLMNAVGDGDPLVKDKHSPQRLSSGSISSRYFKMPPSR